MPAVPIGAAGEKFLKFDTFLCIFKAFFRFPSPVRGGGTFPLPPPLATPLNITIIVHKKIEKLSEWRKIGAPNSKGKKNIYDSMIN